MVTDTTELRRIFEVQKANRWRVAEATAPERIAKLVRLRDAILEERSKLHAAIHEDFRKNPVESDVTEVFPVVAELNHAIRHLRRWMQPVRVRTPLALFGTASEVRYEARGLVLVLSPWNYPFQLSLNPVITAVAAGNCVVLKPSSKVPATTRFIASLLGRVFREDEVAVVTGGHDVSDALLELPFDHFFFTGSPAIGRKVMAAAAQHLATVTLELGGKSPVIIDETADLKAAAEHVMWGKFVNAGQTCVAPDYVLVQESVEGKFIEECRKVLDHRYGRTPEDREKSPDFARLVSVAHAEQLKKVLDDSVGAGARIAYGGRAETQSRFIEPTLLQGLSVDSPIMREEIFGPILPILKCRSMDTAIDQVRGREKPLALYIFSRRKSVIRKILARTTSGGVTVNSTLLHVASEELPFGGVGMSGMGNYHGFFGFRALSHERGVLHRRSPDLIRYFFPPYTGLVRWMVDFFVKRVA